MLEFSGEQLREKGNPFQFQKCNRLEVKAFLSIIIFHPNVENCKYYPEKGPRTIVTHILHQKSLLKNDVKKPKNLFFKDWTTLSNCHLTRDKQINSDYQF